MPRIGFCVPSCHNTRAAVSKSKFHQQHANLQEVERLREALERGDAKTLEACKSAEEVRTKYNDTHLTLHEANGRIQGLVRELEDSKKSLDNEIKSAADKEAALMKEQAYCRSLEKELAAFKFKFQDQETALVSARESDRNRSLTLAELEVSLNTTRSSMGAEHTKLQQVRMLGFLTLC